VPFFYLPEKKRGVQRGRSPFCRGSGTLSGGQCEGVPEKQGVRKKARLYIANPSYVILLRENYDTRESITTNLPSTQNTSQNYNRGK
jgi:hypothetical protein